MVEYIFTSNHLYDHLKSLSKYLGVEIVNNTIQYPKNVGRGYLKYISLPNNLEVSIIDLELNNEVTFKRKASNKEFYTLRFEEIYAPELLSIQIGDEILEEKKCIKSTAYLTSSLLDFAINTTAGLQYKAILILFSKEWIAKYLYLKNTDEVLQNYLDLKINRINSEIFDLEYDILFNEIFNSPENNPLQTIYIQNRLLLLIERFFTRLYTKSLLVEKKSKLNGDEITLLTKVERQLCSNFNVKLPQINAFAKETGMSASKLKASFKLIYGKSIYAYYQDKRMEKAKELLDTGVPIKKIAFDIGYGTVSNFQKAYFKKYAIHLKNKKV